MNTPFINVLARTAARIKEIERIALRYKDLPVAKTKIDQALEAAELTPVIEEVELYFVLLSGLRCMVITNEQVNAVSKEVFALSEWLDEVWHTLQNRQFSYYRQGGTTQ